MQPAPVQSTLASIRDLSEQLSHSDNVRENIRSGLEVLAKAFNAKFAFFAESRETDEIRLAESHGLGLSEFRRLDSKVSSEAFLKVLDGSGTVKSTGKITQRRRSLMRFSPFSFRRCARAAGARSA
jgi:hypothetical protein